jgi:hypothetical protein
MAIFHQWWLWIVFMLLFFVGPISYGWGYRKWGAPFPRYIQRRLGAKTGTGGDFATLSYQHWGWGGDLVWMVLLLGAVWAVAGLWWR